MKTEITRSTWEDIVFESRNKEYGAYSIRKSYDENVSKASLIALLFAAFVFGMLQVASMMQVKIKMPIPISDPGGFTIPPIIVPNPPVKTATARAEQKVNRNVLEKVVTQEVEPPPVVPAEPILPSNETGRGAGVTAEGIVLNESNTGIPVVVDPSKIFDIAQVMPEYEGGVSAMIKFLQKNLHYPPSARNMAIEGSVFIRFVVNDHGQVVNVEVVKGINAALDTEAARVVVLMKKWKPGMQHDVPVNVRMVLPIKFKLEQE